MSESQECQFCKKTFKTANILAQHKKRTKYCLTLQGKENKNFTCSYCDKSLVTNERLLTHIAVCKEKKRKDAEEKNSNLKSSHKKDIKEILKKMEEKDKLNTEKLENKDRYYMEQIINLNQTIAKLESKLEKFEDAVISSKKPTDSDDSEIEKEEVPIPLKEQMSRIVIEEINDEEIEYSNITLNNVVISSRPIDHYVNATQLCKAGGKKFSHWFSLETTKELINELSPDAGIPASGLVDTKRGGNNKSSQGSWIHPDLSIQLAQWISPKFAIQVSKWIRTLFNDGSVQIDLALIRDKDRNMRIKDHRIKQLEAVCLSKQRRVEYPERNVIYMLTTDDHLRRRTYIIGKAKNLTQRLSTYNKTCDHTVIHYRECKNDEDMDTAEILVLNKLRDYREQANRDRFILPEGTDVSFFTDTIEQCVSFLG
jgi:hypothetical protein